MISMGWGGTKFLRLTVLVGGFKYVFYFHPRLGKIPNLTNIFQRG